MIEKGAQVSALVNIKGVLQGLLTSGRTEALMKSGTCYREASASQQRPHEQSPHLPALLATGQIDCLKKYKGLGALTCYPWSSFNWYKSFLDVCIEAIPSALSTILPHLQQPMSDLQQAKIKAITFLTQDAVLLSALSAYHQRMQQG